MPVVQVVLPEIFIQGIDIKELQKEIKEALVIKRYARGDLSMGEVAEILGMNYIDAHEWMNKQGVATTRKFAPELEKAADDNMREFAQELGVSLD